MRARTTEIANIWWIVFCIQKYIYGGCVRVCHAHGIWWLARACVIAVCGGGVVDILSIAVA